MPTSGEIDIKEYLADSFTRSMTVIGATTSLPLDSNNVTLDPNVRDRYGLPAARVTYYDHEDDLAMGRFLQAKGVDIMYAAGAKKVVASNDGPSTITPHLPGTRRMGNDPQTSVVDRFHRSHEAPNLFLCDGSSLVTSGREQPTMTVRALAFRAADRELLFSEAVRVGDILYVSGKLGNEAGTMKLVPGGIGAETRQTIEHIKAIMERHGFSMDKPIRRTVFLADIAEWGKMNSV